MLQKLSWDASKPFPSLGRVVARHKDSTAEALLELPAAETKSQDDLHAVPAGIWVTIGLLAQDGFALQVRLKRTPRPSKRDKTEGTWRLYHAVGGAITMLKEIKQPEAAPEPQATTIYEMD